MAAYSYHPHHFLPRSTLFPNTPFDISSFSNNNMMISSTEFSPMEVHNYGCSDALAHHQSSCQEHSSKMQSATSSIDMGMIEEKKSRKGSSLNSSQSKRRKVQGNNKTKKEKKSNNVHVEEKKKKTKANKRNPKECCSDDTHKDYIHVRARRGQATDSHSLAERVRRERISERMKMLQALVPGCEKVTGKALMLDEIINYVQSLQNQIEFLSMKLASFNPIYSNLAMDLDAAIQKQEILRTWSSSSQPSISSQLCSPTTGLNYNGSTTPFTAHPTVGFHPLIDSSLLLQQEDAENLAWDDQMDSQTQNFMNQSDLGNVISCVLFNNE